MELCSNYVILVCTVASSSTFRHSNANHGRTIVFQVAQHSWFHSPVFCSATRAKLQEGLQHNMQWVYQGEQRVFQTFCSQYNLKAFPTSKETLMFYITYLDEHLKWHYATIQHHLAVIRSVHIVLGMQNPMDNCPRLHQLLCATRRQQPLPQPDSGRQGITSTFLCRARPLHCHSSHRDKVLWAALTNGSLWPIPQWGASTTQAGRSRSYPLHQGTGCHTSLLHGPASLHLHLPGQ